MIDLEAYRRDGYVIVRGPDVEQLKMVLSSALARCALAVIEKELMFQAAAAALSGRSIGEIVDYVVQNETSNEVSSRLYRIFPTMPELIASIAHPVILGCIQALGLVTPVAGTIPTVRIDRPGDEVHRTPPHQDWWFSLLSPNCVTVWFPLRQLTADMGLLEVVPGSHRRGAIDFRPNDEENNNPFRPETEWSESDFAPVELADDAMLIFSQYLLHRSGFNRSLRSRLSVQLRYNDLNTMARAETSYAVQHSDYVLKQQKLLLRAK